MADVYYDTVTMTQVEETVVIDVWPGDLLGGRPVSRGAEDRGVSDDGDRSPSPPDGGGSPRARGGRAATPTFGGRLRYPPHHDGGSAPSRSRRPTTPTFGGRLDYISPLDDEELAYDRRERSATQAPRERRRRASPFDDEELAYDRRERSVTQAPKGRRRRAPPLADEETNGHRTRSVTPAPRSRGRHASSSDEGELAYDRGTRSRAPEPRGPRRCEATNEERARDRRQRPTSPAPSSRPRSASPPDEDEPARERRRRATTPTFGGRLGAAARPQNDRYHWTRQAQPPTEAGRISRRRCRAGRPSSEATTLDDRRTHGRSPLNTSEEDLRDEVAQLKDQVRLLVKAGSRAGASGGPGTRGDCGGVRRPTSGEFEPGRAGIPEFKGEQTDYRGFMKLFNRIVQGRGLSDDEKLTALFSRCTGKVRKIIEPCLDATDGRGYTMALSSLQQEYGSNLRHHTADIMRISEGSIIGSDDLHELTKLHRELADFIASADADDTLSNYECPVVMARFMTRFDKSLLDPWTRTYHRWLTDNGMSEEKGRVKALKCLCSFLDDQVVMAAHHPKNQPGGGGGEAPNKDRSRSRSPRNRRRPFKKPDFRQREIGYTGTEAAGPYQRRPAGQVTESAGPCPACGGDHSSLPGCRTFRGMTPSARKNVTRTGNRCYVCLNPGHDGRECTAAGCNVDNCGGRHSRWLHDIRQPPQGNGTTSSGTTATKRTA